MRGHRESRGTIRGDDRIRAQEPRSAIWVDHIDAREAIARIGLGDDHWAIFLRLPGRVHATGRAELSTPYARDVVAPIEAARYQGGTVKPCAKHIELVEATNNARTEVEHQAAIARLVGFRIGLREAGVTPNLVGCDLFYVDQDINRPMCCGVFLDWKASK